MIAAEDDNKIHIIHITHINTEVIVMIYQSYTRISPHLMALLKTNTKKTLPASLTFSSQIIIKLKLAVLTTND